MIIVAGTISMHPEDRAAFLENGKDAMTGTHAEEGNHCYVFSADPTDDGAVRIFEIWDSQDLLAGHAKSDHMRAFGAANKGLRFTGRDLSVYDVSDERKL